MAKVLYNPSLLKKLSGKIGKSEKYTREQITKRAKGYSPVAYFIYWLSKENIHSAIYQRSLSDNIKSDVQKLLYQNQSTKLEHHSISRKVNRTEKVVQIKEPNVQAKPSLLSATIIKDAGENAKIYPTLYLFENSTRCFIKNVLERKYGENWWNITSVVNNDIKQKVSQRLQDEKINSFHGKRGVHEIFYTDFSELATIVKNNAGIFNPLFSGIKGKTSFLTQKLEELAMSRNTIAHTCPLKKKDKDRFFLYFQDWYDQLDIINNRLSSPKKN